MVEIKLVNHSNSRRNLQICQCAGEPRRNSLGDKCPSEIGSCHYLVEVNIVGRLAREPTRLPHVSRDGSKLSATLTWWNCHRPNSMVCAERESHFLVHLCMVHPVSSATALQTTSSSLSGSQCPSYPNRSPQTSILPFPDHYSYRPLVFTALSLMYLKIWRKKTDSDFIRDGLISIKCWYLIYGVSRWQIVVKCQLWGNSIPMPMIFTLWSGSGTPITYWYGKKLKMH